MIRLLMIVLLAMTAPSPIEAKTKTVPTKTAQTRVADAFKTLQPYRPPTRKLPSQVGIDQLNVDSLIEELRQEAAPKILRLRQPPQYIADRPAFYVNGKLMMYRECEVDAKQDPGESSCRVVWAWI